MKTERVIKFAAFVVWKAIKYMLTAINVVLKLFALALFMASSAIERITQL